MSSLDLCGARERRRRVLQLVTCYAVGEAGATPRWAAETKGRGAVEENEQDVRLGGEWRHLRRRKAGGCLWEQASGIE